MQFSMWDYGPIQFSRRVPKELVLHRIPGAEAAHAVDRYGEIFYQTVQTPHYTFWHTVYRMQEDNTVVLRNHTPWLGFRLMLKNHIRHHLLGWGDVYLKQGQFNFCYAPHVDNTYRLQKQNDYVSFDMTFSAEFVEQSRSKATILDHFLQQSREQKTVLLVEHYAWSSVEVLDTLEQLMQFPHDKLRARKLLEMLVSAAARRHRKKELSERAIERIFQARDIIKNNILEHHYIPLLSRRVSMNDHDLKEGFMQVFDMGIYEYLKHERLQMAKHLLKTTRLTLAEIAAATGFKAAPALITAFRKKIGMTPAAWRKLIIFIFLGILIQSFNC